MQELIQRILANGLADFEGLEVSGSIPLRQEFVNEAIATVLQTLQSPAPSSAKASAANAEPTAASSGSSKAKIPIAELAGMVKKVEMQAVEGKVIVQFEIKR